VQINNNIILLFALVKCVAAVLLQLLLFLPWHCVHFGVVEDVRPEVNKSLFEDLVRGHGRDGILLQVQVLLELFVILELIFVDYFKLCEVFFKYIV
jgi:hypothetical protein